MPSRDIINIISLCELITALQSCKERRLQHATSYMSRAAYRPRLSCFLCGTDLI